MQRIMNNIKPGTLNKEGRLITDSNGIHIKGATEIILMLSAATSFNGFDKCPDKDGKDEHLAAQRFLAQAEKKSYQILLNEHLTDHHQFYKRVSLSINNFKNSRAKLPTDERLAAYTRGFADNGLEALYFNYGRYPLISSFRT